MITSTYLDKQLAESELFHSLQHLHGLRLHHENAILMPRKSTK